MLVLDPGLIDRLWRDVDRTSPDCWLWTGSRGLWGHGRFKYRGKVYYVHRVSYAAERGPIPTGYAVRQRCRRAACFRPDHLYTAPRGTTTAEMRERQHPWAGGLKSRKLA